MLLDVSGPRKRSILLQGKQRNVAARVVRDEHELAAAIHTHVAGRTTFRRLLIAPSEIARLARNIEGAHSTALSSLVRPDLIRGIENAAVRMNREERWIRAGLH